MEFREFDLSLLNDGASILIIGNRGSGKTSLVQDILTRKNYLTSTIFTRVPCTTEQYSSKFPTAAVYTLGDQIPELTTELNSCNMQCVVFDDCWSGVMNIIPLALSTKVFGSTVIVTVQDSRTLSVSIISQFDFVFLRQNTTDGLYKRFCHNMFDTCQEFETVMDKHTVNYGYLVMDQRNSSKPLEEQVFWYRVKFPESNVLACKSCCRVSDGPFCSQCGMSTTPISQQSKLAYESFLQTYESQVEENNLTCYNIKQQQQLLSMQMRTLETQLKEQHNIQNSLKTEFIENVRSMLAEKNEI